MRQRREIDVGAQLLFSFSSVKDPSPRDAASSIQSWIPPRSPIDHHTGHTGLLLKYRMNLLPLILFYS